MNLIFSGISKSRRWLCLLVIWSGAALAACNLGANPAVEPTLNVTQAYQTVEARLTQAVALTPSSLPATELPVPTLPLATRTVQATLTAAASKTPLALTPSAACDRAAAGADIDVTIPDNTELQPGQSFTKTWRLQNAGTCTWTQAYAVVWFSGEKMGASGETALLGDVAPGQTVELSVDLLAPDSPGTYQGNWKLRNQAGVLFGIGPNGESSFWVRIVVVAATQSTATPTSGPTSEPSPTPTVGVKASGPATLAPGDALDLDTNQVNGGDGDLIYTVSDQAVHSLDPSGGAAVAVFGGAQPSLADCQSITLSADPLGLDALAPGTYLCYRTGMALPGWARLDGIDGGTGVLSLEILTWAIP